MIRTNKILAEANAPNTVLTNEILDNGKILTAVDKLLLATKELGTGIIVADENGNVGIMPLSNDNVNKILVTDENGNLKWIGG